MFIKKIFTFNSTLCFSATKDFCEYLKCIYVLLIKKKQKAIHCHLVDKPGNCSPTDARHPTTLPVYIQNRVQQKLFGLKCARIALVEASQVK